MSVPIGLDPVGKPGELRVSHELGPTGEIEGGLRLEVGKLNGDGHEVTKSMKAPRKQRVKRFGALAIGRLGACVIVGRSVRRGLRINGTHREPVGIYWAISKAPS
jgi:hypothetical protein